jgi:bacillithiol synthase
MRAVSRSIGGSALARRALAGALPDWYLPRPAGGAGWTQATAKVAEEFADRAWLESLLPAFDPSGLAAERLRAASREGGLVVTGGQQPGLFGGPLYVLHKAITLLEMADALASLTGRAVAPVFWAATDDADLAEANHVSVVRHGQLDVLSMADDTMPGRSMANTPLGDVAEQTARLEEACGSAPDGHVLDVVRAAYTSGATVGGAYVALLRSLLEPLGIAVLDASHSAVRIAGRNTMHSALMRATDIATALSARTDAISAAGLRAQVADVPNLSLVFETMDDGTRRRIPLRDANAIAKSAAAERLGPNVLLRPILERAILPTVSYVGGAGEVAYFAQVSAVADAMGAAVPRITPRWSGTLVEPHVQSILDRFGATIEDFRDPHAMEGRVARAAVSPGVQSGIAALRAALDASCEKLCRDEQTSDALARSVGAMRAGVEHRLARLERRYTAALKRAGSEDLRDVATVRASLYPNGTPQERVLSFIPFLARYGAVVLNAIREQARLHVTDMIHGD